MSLSNPYLFKVLKLNAVAKYPHLLVESENSVCSSELSLDFGKVLIGQSATRYFTIVNMTEVLCFFLLSII